MTHGHIRICLVLLVVAGVGMTALALTRPTVRPPWPAPRAPGVEAVPNQVDVAPPEEAVARVITRPVFRADRRPPLVGYDPEQGLVPESAIVPPAPKPQLAVSGIVWGDQPAAVVEGVPGQDGSVVLRRGETVAGLRVSDIVGDRVVIRGMDTTWRLTVRMPW